MQRKIIIIKKKAKKSHGGHHGGSWKIAYADFVTAMMAFFMMMWLIQIITDGQKKGIADYFSRNITLSQLKTSPKSSASGTAASKKEKDSSTNSQGMISTEDKVEPIQDILVDSQKTEQKKFKDISKNLEVMFSKKEQLKPYMNNIAVSIVPEGIKIQIFDSNQRAMFPSGSDVLHPEFSEIFAMVAETVRSLSNPIEVSGHTDANPYGPSKNYSNWELSSDRANSARRTLERNNIPSKRFASVVGKETSEPLVPTDLFSPKNRRISIMLLREHRLTHDQLKSLDQPKVKPEQSKKP